MKVLLGLLGIVVLFAVFWGALALLIYVSNRPGNYNGGGLFIYVAILFLAPILITVGALL